MHDYRIIIDSDPTGAGRYMLSLDRDGIPACKPFDAGDHLNSFYEVASCAIELMAVIEQETGQTLSPECIAITGEVVEKYRGIDKELDNFLLNGGAVSELDRGAGGRVNFKKLAEGEIQ